MKKSPLHSQSCSSDANHEREVIDRAAGGRFSAMSRPFEKGDSLNCTISLPPRMNPSPTVISTAAPPSRYHHQESRARSGEIPRMPASQKLPQGVLTRPYRENSLNQHGGANIVAISPLPLSRSAPSASVEMTDGEGSRKRGQPELHDFIGTILRNRDWWLFRCPSFRRDLSSR